MVLLVNGLNIKGNYKFANVASCTYIWIIFRSQTYKEISIIQMNIAKMIEQIMHHHHFRKVTTASFMVQVVCFSLEIAGKMVIQV